MKTKIYVIIFISIFISGVTLYSNIESKENYLKRLKTFDSENQIRYRISPMPDVFVPKKYELRDWNDVIPSTNKENQK